MEPERLAGIYAVAQPPRDRGVRRAGERARPSLEPGDPRMGPCVTCRRVTECVSEYLDGRLDHALRRRLGFHLWRCLGCRAHVRQMQQTIHVLRRLPRMPAPTAIREELLERFRDRSRRTA